MRISQKVVKSCSKFVTLFLKEGTAFAPINFWRVSSYEGRMAVPNAECWGGLWTAVAERSGDTALTWRVQSPPSASGGERAWKTQRLGGKAPSPLRSAGALQVTKSNQDLTTPTLLSRSYSCSRLIAASIGLQLGFGCEPPVYGRCSSCGYGQSKC